MNKRLSYSGKIFRNHVVNGHINYIIITVFTNLYDGIWDKQPEIKDTEIRKLATTLPFVVESELAS